MSTADSLSVADVAKSLRVSQRTVYRWIENRKLAATDLGTNVNARWRISPDDLEEFLQKRRSDAAP